MIKSSRESLMFWSQNYFFLAGAGWLWLTVGTMTLAVEVLGDDHQLEFSRRLQGWDNLGHTTNKTGTQPHPAADSLPKDSLR